ncbi:ATP-binding protein, partial [Alishewanella sp. HH-ZS]|uniref:ATP-binding protein n=1 Tax=Alishewanella sp. HH-ZS TaxID=1856684 RepID=UPI00159F2374
NTHAGALEEYLAEANYSPAEISKVLRSDYSSLQWENSVPERYLSDFYEHFFSKITEPSQRLMLEYCFVSDSKLDSYKGELKRVLKDVKPKYLPVNSLDLEPGAGKDNILDERTSGQVIIITGSVGCGKSTLVTKCLVEARQSKGNLAKAILIDLINEVTRSEIDARNIIFKLIYEFIYEKYDFVFGQEFLRKLYKKEIKIMEEGEYKDLFVISEIDRARHEAKLISDHKMN